jgi:hypothetical protein
VKAEVSRSEIVGTLAPRAAVLVDSDPTELSRIPEQWLPILTASDASARLEAAVELWNQGFFDLVPEFAAALTMRFLDVRVAITDGDPVLVYVARDGTGAAISWVGLDPRTFDEPPQFWEIFPDSLRIFLRDVHAGFISGPEAAFGPLPPGYMVTLAELAGFPEGIPDWEQNSEIASTRLLRIATNGWQLDYCLSPDLPADAVALVYEGDVDSQALGPELDQLMMKQFET